MQGKAFQIGLRPLVRLRVVRLGGHRAVDTTFRFAFVTRQPRPRGAPPKRSPMQLGVVGLGRMGGNIVRRLMRAGHECVVHDRDPVPGRALAGEGATAAGDLASLVAALDAPRAVWVMLPSGEATEGAVAALAGLLSPGDTVIDGGNSFWKDDVRRAGALREKGLHYLDVGTSGGVDR